MKEPGAQFLSYGTPSRFENKVVRNWAAPANPATPGIGSARTPHQFLDGTGNQLRRAAQQVQLVGVVVAEQQDGVGQDAGGGLVPARDEEEECTEQLRFGEPVVLVAGGDQRAEQVVGRRTPLGGDQAGQVCLHGDQRRLDLLGAVQPGRQDEPEIQPCLPVHAASSRLHYESI